MKLRAGFTLIELLVTLAVVAIALSLAVPGFAAFIRDQRATGQANDLLVSLTFARSEAIKRGAPITVCASADGSTCAGNSDWEAGWILFVDEAGPGPNGTVDTGDTVLRVHQALARSELVTNAGSAWVAFAPDGLAASRDDFELTPDGCTGDQMRSIDLSATGRARVQEEACP